MTAAPRLAAALAVLLLAVAGAAAQTPPGAAEIDAYDGLHRAAHDGDAAAIERLAAAGADLEARDGNRRTPLLVAAFASQEAAARALIAAGADTDARDADRYDAVTVAAVADDLALLRLLLGHGADPGQVTSPYDGTALIAAAHLGHAGVVRALIDAGAPLDHVNNLGWTAMIEAVILGDGGPRHVATLRALVDAGADPAIADRAGRTPLDHARARGFAAMVAILEAARR